MLRELRVRTGRTESDKLMGGVDLEGAEGSKGYPHNTERNKRWGSREKDSERHKWKKRNPVFRCIRAFESLSSLWLSSFKFSVSFTWLTAEKRYKVMNFEMHAGH